MKSEINAPEEKRTRVMIVDDHAIVRAGLKRLIEEESDFTVCSEASDGPQALEMLSADKPDIVIVDLGLPGMSGLDLIKNLLNREQTPRILVISMYDESIYAERVLRAGAKGYLMKKESAEKVITALRRVREGKLYVSDIIADKIINRISVKDQPPGRSPIDLLSDRELQIFQLIGKGLKSGEIAKQLSLSVKTIESHREQLKMKLKLESASSLAQFAIEWRRTWGTN